MMRRRIIPIFHSASADHPVMMDPSARLPLAASLSAGRRGRTSAQGSGGRRMDVRRNRTGAPAPDTACGGASPGGPRPASTHPEGKDEAGVRLMLATLRAPTTWIQKSFWLGG